MRLPPLSTCGWCAHYQPGEADRTRGRCLAPMPWWALRNEVEMRSALWRRVRIAEVGAEGCEAFADLPIDRGPILP